MFKTVAYNDISSYKSYEDKNGENFLVLCEEFVKNGGNLLLDVKNSEYREELKNFERYVRENLSTKIFKKLIEKKLIDNIFELKIENGEIINHPYVKDNYIGYYEHYSDIIDIEIKKIIDNSESLNINFNNGFDCRTNKLRKLLDHCQSPELYDYLFTKKPELIKLWKIDEEQKERSRYGNYHYIELFRNNWGISHVFVKNGMGVNYFFDDIDRSSAELVGYIIEKNDIKLIDKIFSVFDIDEIEKKYTETNPQECLLSIAKTKEMISYLVSKKRTLIKDDNLFVSNKLSEDDLFLLIDSCEDLKEYLYDGFKYGTKIVRHFIDSYDSRMKIDTIKKLIEKYNFNFKSVDLLSFLYRQDRENFLGNLSWFIEKDAINLEIQKDFIERCLNQRDPGYSLLKKMHKQKMLNAEGPNYYYAVVSGSTTKTFDTWYNGLDIKLNELLIGGTPAWWFTNKKMLPVLNKNENKIDLEQKDLNGGSFLNFYFENCTKESVDFLMKDYYLNELKKKNIKLNLSTVDKFNNNVFHSLFKEKPYGKIYSLHERVREIINNSDYTPEDMGKLLTNKNNEKLMPIELLCINNLDGIINKNHLINEIFKLCGHFIDFNLKNESEVSVESLLINKFPELKDKIIQYKKEILNRKLNENIPIMDKQEKSLKI